MKKLIVIPIIWFTHLICFSQTIKPPDTLMNLRDIKLVYLNGKPCKIEDFKGKFILIDIWGQGCQPCVEAIPKLNELQEKYKNKLVILAINDRIYLKKLPRFLKKHKINYPVVIPTKDGDLMPIYYAFSDRKFTGFPNYTLIDDTGKILARNTHYKKIESYLNQ